MGFPHLFVCLPGGRFSVVAIFDIGNDQDQAMEELQEKDGKFRALLVCCDDSPSGDFYGTDSWVKSGQNMDGIPRINIFFGCDGAIFQPSSSLVGL